MNDTQKNSKRTAGISGIDTWSDAEILGDFVAGQERAIAAVKVAIPQISKAANAVAACLAGVAAC